MRKLVVQQWVTVDNIAAEEDGGLSFVSGEPFDDEITDDPFKNSVMGFIDSVDTMILGANTYAQSKDYWPYAEDQGEYGEKLNSLTKFVASSKLDDAPWGDFPAATVTRDPAATILAAMAAWGDRWLTGPEGTPLVLHHTACEHDMHAVVVCSECAEPLDVRRIRATAGPEGADPLVAAKEAAERAFAACGCRDYARVDFILSEQKQLYLLEINTLPGMTETTPMRSRRSCHAVPGSNPIAIMLASPCAHCR